MKPARAREILLKLLSGEDPGPERNEALSLARDAVGKLDPVRAEAQRKALVVLELWTCGILMRPPEDALATIRAAGTAADDLFLAGRELVAGTVRREATLELVQEETLP